VTLRPFYCQLCDKQFKNVVQYDEHTNSYAHHHKARAKDMQASLKLKPTDQATITLRKEKERIREERALRKMAKAAGVKVGSIPAFPTGKQPHILERESGPNPETVAPETKPKVFGWAAIGQRMGYPPFPSSQELSSGDPLGAHTKLLPSRGQDVSHPPLPPPEDDAIPPPPPEDTGSPPPPPPN
jgi:Wiskott-Aldrich syndrome protein